MGTPPCTFRARVGGVVEYSCVPLRAGAGHDAILPAFLEALGLGGQPRLRLTMQRIASD